MESLNLTFTPVAEKSLFFVASHSLEDKKYVSEKTSIAPLKSIEKLLTLPRKVEYLPSLDVIQVVYSIEVIETSICFVLSAKPFSLEDQVARQREEIRSLKLELAASKACATRAFFGYMHPNSPFLLVTPDLQKHDIRDSAEQAIGSYPNYENKVARRAFGSARDIFGDSNPWSLRGVEAYLLKIQETLDALIVDACFQIDSRCPLEFGLCVKCVDLPPAKEYVVYGGRGHGVTLVYPGSHTINYTFYYK